MEQKEYPEVANFNPHVGDKFYTIRKAKSILAQLLLEYSNQFAGQLKLSKTDIEKVKELSIQADIITRFAKELDDRINIYLVS